MSCGLTLNCTLKPVALPSNPARNKPRSRASAWTSLDRKSTRLNSSHEWRPYDVFCLQKNSFAREQLGGQPNRRPARLLQVLRLGSGAIGQAYTPVKRRSHLAQLS